MPTTSYGRQYDRIIRHGAQNSRVQFSDGSTGLVSNISLSAVYGLDQGRVRVSVTRQLNDFTLAEALEQVTFGVEMEFVRTGISAEDLLTLLRREGLPVDDQSTRYGQSSTTSWVLCCDGSLPSGGQELTTPKLKGSSGFEEFEKYLKVIEKLASDGKMKVMRACGLHVHIGTFGSNSAFPRKLLSSYKKIEKYVDMVVSPSRRQNHYCAPVDVNDTRVKYQKVSVRNYSSNGTFENRLHQGSLNHLKISSWVKFNIHFAWAVAHGEDFSQVSSFEDVISVLKLTPELASYYRGRREELGGDE